MNKYDTDELIHVKNGDLEYIEFKVLNEHNVKNCITLRHGGVSEGFLSSLNFRTLGIDSKENVLENLRRIKEAKGFCDVCKGKQAHTDRVIEINNENKEEYLFSNFSTDEADGYIVSEENIATLITTADCNPIIIFDPTNRVVANVHAGWKGVINRIYINAIKMMIQKYNSNPEELIVCIGPSIRKCCFTSSEESFKEKFTSTFENSEDWLEYENEETFHIDLITILKNEFKKVNVKEENIHIADICTRCNTQDFYSYRYTVQHKEEDYATMATIVSL